MATIVSHTGSLKCWLSETIGDSGLSSPGLSLPFLLVGFSSVPVLYMY